MGQLTRQFLPGYFHSRLSALLLKYGNAGFVEHEPPTQNKWGDTYVLGGVLLSAVVESTLCWQRMETQVICWKRNHEKNGHLPDHKDHVQFER